MELIILCESDNDFIWEWFALMREFTLKTVLSQSGRVNGPLLLRSQLFYHLKQLITNTRTCTTKLLLNCHSIQRSHPLLLSTRYKWRESILSTLTSRTAPATKTRMHSSRMRTARLLTVSHSAQRGVYPGGFLPRGVYPDNPLPRLHQRQTPPKTRGRHPLPVNRITDRYKNITYPQLSLQAAITP